METDLPLPQTARDPWTVLLSMGMYLLPRQGKCTVLYRHRDQELPLWSLRTALSPLTCNLSLKCSEIAVASSSLRKEQGKLTKSRETEVQQEHKK